MSRPEVVSPPATDAVPVPPAGRKRSTLAWMTAGCALLLASGVVRAVQDRRHQAEASITEDCPFPLSEIPTTLGGWKLIPGGERALDPLTMRITGGSEHVMRTYVDELTGVSLVVLVLFGPAAPVIPHTPEICYPSSGYSPAGDSGDRVIDLKGAGKCEVRSAIYAKSSGLSTLREGVYYTFRLGGVWSPNVGAGRKFPRRNPGVFKIQVQRRVAAGEKLDSDDPIEQFLALLIPAIEQKIGPTPKSAGTSKADPGVPAARGADFAPSSAQHLGDGDRPGAWPIAGAASRHRLQEGRKASDRQDEQDHRGEVEDQSPSGRSEGDPIGISSRARILA